MYGRLPFCLIANDILSALLASPNNHGISDSDNFHKSASESENQTWKYDLETTFISWELAQVNVALHATVKNNI